MRTTVDIPDQLFRRLKKAAAEQGTAMRDVILQALGAHLDAAPPAEYVFDWRVDDGPWNPDLPVDSNAAMLELLDPVDRHLPRPPDGE